MHLTANYDSQSHTYNLENEGFMSQYYLLIQMDENGRFLILLQWYSWTKMFIRQRKYAGFPVTIFLIFENDIRICEAEPIKPCQN